MLRTFVAAHKDTRVVAASGFISTASVRDWWKLLERVHGRGQGAISQRIFCLIQDFCTSTLRPDTRYTGAFRKHRERCLPRRRRELRLHDLSDHRRPHAALGARRNQFRASHYDRVGAPHSCWRGAASSVNASDRSKFTYKYKLQFVLHPRESQVSQ